MKRKKYEGLPLAAQSLIYTAAVEEVSALLLKRFPLSGEDAQAYRESARTIRTLRPLLRRGIAHAALEACGELAP